MNKTKTLVLTALFAALAVIGSFIKIPIPPGTPALDAAPAFVSMAFLPAPFAAAAGAIGHIATSFTAGFPLTLPIHILIAAEMAIVVGVGAYLFKKGKKALAWVWVAISNGVLAPLPFYWIISPAVYVAVAPGLLMATGINVVVACIVLPFLQKKLAQSGIKMI